MTERILREGLRPYDLEDTVHHIFEIDSFKSKMGDDRDVCVLSFKVKDRNPARDMMEFIEKGYNFVLDADVSAGEDRNGNYHVFVELERKNELPRQIKEITDGIKKLTRIEDWKFRFHKNFKSYDLNEENLSIIPQSSDSYDSMLENVRVESIQKFFSKTYKEDLLVEGDAITLLKPFGINFKFNIVDFGKSDEIQTKISETIKMDTKSMAEVMWLTKVLGDFNISKYGNEYTLENGKDTMIIKMENLQ
jgi:hypothetical protein